MDSDLAIIMDYKEKGLRPSWEEIADKAPAIKAYWAQWDSLVIENGCLKGVYESSDKKIKQSLVVVPKGRINEIVKAYHEDVSGGYLGINKTLAKVQQRFYWTGCRQSVIDWCQKCDQCVAVKGPVKKVEE